MKKSLIILIILATSLIRAQQEHTKEIFQVDSTWFKESIKFPINFAKEIPYQGHAELRFAPGFTKKDSPELWSYIWAWVITNKKEFTETELEKNIQLYFDGLLGLDPEHHKNVKQQTNAVFLKSKNNKYVGKVKTFDTRYTNQSLTLNITVEELYCQTTNNIILIFRLSPQDFESKVWKVLNKITLKTDFCDN